MSSRPFIRHVVFFSARDKKDVPTIVEGLSRLGNIPHSQNFDVSHNRRKDALSDDVDVIVYAEFESEEALAAYKAHPIYQESIDIVRPLRELRIAADF
ncbi:Dabb family protein [Aliiruegeria lutimaris]|uniref:Stress responsive A/B Barrel Domain n=1 Tax=Aliiruegeria lutimaris TaxID=571298 RepID=A0A1G9AXI4_9RHOB|nr:Dabb family protein [Aliiruegeria lutimaris]SDK31962.1 Stress responsive A/B Barrel Domain [Aliiruegeria lutimaris]